MRSIICQKNIIQVYHEYRLIHREKYNKILATTAQQAHSRINTRIHPREGSLITPWFHAKKKGAHASQKRGIKHTYSPIFYSYVHIIVTDLARRAEIYLAT